MQLEVKVFPQGECCERPYTNQVLGRHGQRDVIIIRQRKIGGGKCSDCSIFALVGAAGEQMEGSKNRWLMRLARDLRLLAI